MSTQTTTQQTSQVVESAKRSTLIEELCAARGTQYKELHDYRSL